MTLQELADYVIKKAATGGTRGMQVQAIRDGLTPTKVNNVGYKIMDKFGAGLNHLATTGKQFKAVEQMTRENNARTPDLNSDRYRRLNQMVPIQRNKFVQKTVLPFAQATQRNIFEKGVGNVGQGIAEGDPIKVGEGLGRQGLAGVSLHSFGNPLKLAQVGGVSAGLGAGIGAVGAAWNGTDISEGAEDGAYTGMSRAPGIAGIAKFTNPLQDKIASTIGGRFDNEAISWAVKYAVGGLASIPEGMAMNTANDIPYTKEDLLFDVVSGGFAQSGLPISSTVKAQIKEQISEALKYAVKSEDGFIGAAKSADEEGAFSAIHDKKMRIEFSDANSRIKPGVGSKPFSEIKTVGDILDHPTLYERYPDFKNIKISFEKDGMRGGSYNPKTNAITVGGFTDKKSLLHEIEHAIQEKENFARGGSPSAFSTNDDPGYWQLQMKFRQLVGDGKNAEAAKVLDEMSEYGFKQYQRTGGEMESRAVESRADLTQDELRSSDPYTSQGIPTDKVITRFGNTGDAMFSIKDPNAVQAPDPFAKGIDLPPAKPTNKILNNKVVNPTEGVYKNPAKMQSEALIEGAGGWKPGLRQEFDQALFNKDAAKVKQLLPDVPADYRAKFSKEINEVTTGDIDNFLANKLGGKTFEYEQRAGSGVVSKGLDIGDNKIRYQVIEQSEQLLLPNVIIENKGTGLGTKFMSAMKDLADEKGKNLVVMHVKNPEFFDKFSWLKYEGGAYRYSPTKSKGIFATISDDIKKAEKVITGEKGFVRIGDDKPTLKGVDPNKRVGNLYEKNIGEGLEKQGYEVEYRGAEKGMKDGGIDLIARKNGETLLIQNKMRAKDLKLTELPITNFVQDVRNYLKQNPTENVKPVLYTTVDPEAGAAQIAKQYGIEIVKKGLWDEGLSGKMRGFPLTVKKTPGTPEQLSAQVANAKENYYAPTTNKETVEYVTKKILSKGDAFALKTARSENNPNANATAMLLIDKYLKGGKIEEANQLIKDVSPRFTKQGQGIQILSLYGRLTPTGAMKYAQHVIDEANQTRGSRAKLELSSEQGKQIVAAAEKIQALPEGSRQRIVAIAQMMDKIASTVPPSWGQRISTIQTMAQLLNPKTAIRNTLGNSIFAGFDNLSDVVGTGVDKFISIGTGQRTKVLPSITAQLKGVLKGGAEGLEDARLGIDTSGGVASQFDLPNRTFRGKYNPLTYFEKAMNVELRATDRAAYTGAYEGSLNNQMRAAKVTTPTPKMIEVAKADGLYRTFQDNSKLAEMFTNTKKILNKVGTPDGKFGLGDLILKYPKTPANLLSRGLDYSPVGFVKALYQATRPYLGGADFDQKQFVETFSRGLVGTGLLSSGYVLAANGVITSAPSEDKDIRSLEQTMGGGGFRINVDALKRWVSDGVPQSNKVGDTTVTYDWAQPVALGLAMGANMHMNPKGQDKFTSMIEQLDAGTSALTQQSVVKGVSQFMGDVDDYGAARAFVNAGLSIPASFVPSLLNQAVQLEDNTLRETYDPSIVKTATNRAIARIPKLQGILPDAIDTLGGTKERYQDGSNTVFNVLFNPSFVGKIKDNPGAAEVLDLYKRSGEVKQAPRNVDKKVKIDGKDVALTGDQYTYYQQYVGGLADVGINKLIKTEEYKAMDDDKKATKISDLLTEINKKAKTLLFSGKSNILNIPTTRVNEGDEPKNSTELLTTYAHALSVDPTNAFKGLFTDEELRKVTGNAAILKRREGLDVLDNGDKSTQIDHKTALSLGGDNALTHLEPLPNEVNSAKGVLETKLYRQLESGEITRQEAQKQVAEWRKTQGGKTPIATIASTDKKDTKPDTSEDTEGDGGGEYDLYVPRLVGDAELDKLENKKYQDSISRAMKKLQEQYNKKELSPEDFKKKRAELEALRSTEGGTGKSTGKKGRKAPKITISRKNAPKAPAFKLRRSAPIKIPNITMPKIKSAYKPGTSSRMFTIKA